jgi:hypothetical protein
MINLDQKRHNDNKHAPARKSRKSSSKNTNHNKHQPQFPHPHLPLSVFIHRFGLGQRETVPRTDCFAASQHLSFHPSITAALRTTTNAPKNRNGAV